MPHETQKTHARSDQPQLRASEFDPRVDDRGGSILSERYHVCICVDPRPLVPGATCRRCHKPVQA